jgi:hypothetical protein
MATVGKSYAVRDADTGTRLGKVYKTYPYTLRSLLEALEDARLRSYNEPPQVVTVVTDRQSIVIRRYEGGRELPRTSLRTTGLAPSSQHHRRNLAYFDLGTEDDLVRLHVADAGTDHVHSVERPARPWP